MTAEEAVRQLIDTSGTLLDKNIVFDEAMLRVRSGDDPEEAVAGAIETLEAYVNNSLTRL